MYTRRNLAKRPSRERDSRRVFFLLRAGARENGLVGQRVELQVVINEAESSLLPVGEASKIPAEFNQLTPASTSPFAFIIVSRSVEYGFIIQNARVDASRCLYRCLNPNNAVI